MLAPVPNKLAKIDWKEAGQRIRMQVQAQLEKTLLPGLGECLEVSHFVTPDDFEGKFNTLWGSGFSIAPLFRQSAWFRFHNQSEDWRTYFLRCWYSSGCWCASVVSSAKVVEKLVPPSRLGKEARFRKFSAQEPNLFVCFLLLPKERASNLQVILCLSNAGRLGGRGEANSRMR